MFNPIPFYIRWQLLLAAIILVGGGVTLADAQCELAKLLPPDGAAGDLFGWPVAISGDVAVVGASGDDDNGYYSGSAYVFRFDGTNWVGQAKLLAPNGRRGDMFGFSVAISGSTVVVGAPGDRVHGDRAGSAHVFRYDGSNWLKAARLIASDGEASDAFGSSVAVFGDVAVVGADLDDDNGYNAGSVYVFRFDGSHWVEQAKLLGAGGTWECFGCSVALSGNTALVGAPRPPYDRGGYGAAHVFRYDDGSWVEEQELVASDGDALELGCSVALAGDAAVIGSVSGSAYVFRYDGSSWVEEQELVCSDGSGPEKFGRSVAISGDTVMVGAYGDDEGGGNAGAAYVFHFDGSNWVEEAKLLASDGSAGDWFGGAVAVAGRAAVIGAYADDENGSYSGSAYVFRVTSCPGDIDGDSDVDLSDLAELLGNYGATSGARCGDGDLDGDTDVDSEDLVVLLDNYGVNCP